MKTFDLQNGVALREPMYSGAKSTKKTLTIAAVMGLVTLGVICFAFSERVEKGGQFT